MAKPKSPLLSLGARGTIGDALTYQRRGREHIVREKPIPTDPYSLRQAYQRWLYKDYAYLWTLLSNAEKQIYRTKASRYHITGFSQWMREQLRDLPDIVGWWKLDDNLGVTTIDSSPYEHTATIFGASPTTLAIDGALDLDGINDYLNIPHASHISLAYPFTIQFFINTTYVTDQEFLTKVLLGAPWTGVAIRQVTNKLAATLYNTAGAVAVITSTLTINDGITHLITLLYDGALFSIYLDTSLGGSIAFTGSIENTRPLTLGFNTVGWAGTWLMGSTDNLIIRNRILNLTEITRHSGRRYPV